MTTGTSSLCEASKSYAIDGLPGVAKAPGRLRLYLRGIMEVSITSRTPDMVSVISRAAGLCYGKDDKSIKRLRSCYRAGHTGILEHASVSFVVRGVSRSCSHQLVRHRIASYCQESQRYCKYDLSGDDWYVVPEKLRGDSGRLERYRSVMRVCADEYKSLLDAGYRPEDARFALPESTKTSIFVTMDIRSLFHFFDLRLGEHAQWEVRKLAKEMLEQLRSVEPELTGVYEEFRDKTRID